MLDDICRTCGHTRRQHIYYEGACRPGFVCEAGCTEFVGEKSAMYYVEQGHRERGAAEERERIVAWLRESGQLVIQADTFLDLASSSQAQRDAADVLADAIERGGHREAVSCTPPGTCRHCNHADGLHRSLTTWCNCHCHAMHERAEQREAADE